ncbi:IclR family transcriptional regulator [Paraburkholderia terrae]|uniref:IclR family transcriptional regulator n=1 Tax=Paraburkholderia terrae TaxID=311230 RepID=A0ABM7TZY9_9BURK|nr:IclR family transcriptional regulator [Paraburkholderia terrae]BCZ79966.1 IclR family transcriptional regulator [Paraburkholderia terrae]BDC41565.1 IclR family transcriptional regulator [Paraburkholderia terrae]
MEKVYEVPALKRAQDILDVLSGAREPVRVSALREATGLSRSTLYLLLDSLQRQHWVEKHGDGYLIGVKLFELGNAYVRHDGYQSVFRALAASFVAAHDEVVQLATLDGTDVVYIAREDSRRPVRLVSDLGSRLPAHCSALGKALLATLSEAELNELLPEKLTAVTPATITRRAVLLRELAVVRENGQASEFEESAAGLACFAAYVGQTAYGKRLAVSTSIPIGRIDQKREKRIRLAIAKMALQIGARLGNI